MEACAGEAAAHRHGRESDIAPAVEEEMNPSKVDFEVTIFCLANHVMRNLSNHVIRIRDNHVIRNTVEEHGFSRAFSCQQGFGL